MGLIKLFRFDSKFLGEVIMIKINNNRVMPIPEARKNQGEQHQPHQPQNQSENNNSQGQNGGSLFEPSTFQQTSPIGKNLYIEARWGTEKVKANSPVQIFAQLNTALNETVTINIFHKFNGQDVQVASLKADMKNGYVETIWQAQNPDKNRNQGYYFFMIFGGKANSISKNQLVLS